jgi:hypothetical protein
MSKLFVNGTLVTLAGDVRRHLMVASSVLAHLRPRRGIAGTFGQPDM